MKPSSKVIADTGRSSGKVIRQNRCQPLAPSIAAASNTSVEMLCSPLYMMTRLKGMPIQMFAISTEASDQDGEVSQSTGPTANWNAIDTKTKTAVLMSAGAKVEL